MKPSIAFIIVRMNWYRHMAPAIDAALGRGWHVECWLDVGDPMHGRPLDFPKAEWMPKFRNGQPVLREYRGFSEALEWIRHKRVDAVVNLWPLFGLRAGQWPARSKRSLYVLLEASPTDWFTHAKDPEELGQVDLFALTTSYWLEQDIQLMRETLPFEITPEFESNLRQKARVVGWPQVDQLSMIDPVEVRQRWGIPNHQPVLVYLNWALGFMGLRLTMFQLSSATRRARAIMRHPGQWGNAVQLFKEKHLGDVKKALRAFCDRNGIYLIVKYRNRDQTHVPEVQMADRVLTDTTYYPHTIFEAMCIANLSVSYFSFGVRESVAAGTPHAVFNVAGLDRLTMMREPESVNHRFSQPDGFWNSPGVVWKMESDDITSKLSHMSLADFEIDHAAARGYYTKYLGVPGVSNSNLFLDAVEQLIEENRLSGGRA